MPFFTTDKVIATLRQAQGKPPRRYENLPVKRVATISTAVEMKNQRWYYKKSFLDSFLGASCA